MSTRKELAEKAGVSLSVVSRALNNSGYVEAEKKKRILKAAEELGYYPNPVAMSLQQRRTRQILFFCKDISNSYNLEMYRGMLKAASEKNYMVVFNSNPDFSNIRNTMIDGIILPDEWMTCEYVRQVGKNYHIPAVSAVYSQAVSFERSIPVVKVDMYRVVDIAIKALQRKGHRKIAFATPFPADHYEARMLAFKDLMSANYGKEIERYCISPFHQDESGDIFEAGKAGAHIYHRGLPDVTAIVCFNDEYALGMMQEFKALGIGVPEKVSIIGIDGAPARKYVMPPLTSVGLFPDQLGAKCVRILLNMIEGNVNEILHTEEPSTGAPADTQHLSETAGPFPAGAKHKKEGHGYKYVSTSSIRLLKGQSIKQI